MNNFTKGLVIGSLILLGASAAQAAPKKPAGDVSVTLANASASALVDFSLIEMVPAPAATQKVMIGGLHRLIGFHPITPMQLQLPGRSIFSRARWLRKSQSA